MALKFIPEVVFTEMLRARPELAMAYHLLLDSQERVCAIAVGGLILLDLDESFHFHASRVAKQEWNADRPSDDYAEHLNNFDLWCQGLPRADFGDVTPDRTGFVSRFTLDPFDPSLTARGPSPPIVMGRPSVHGHLPFSGKTGSGSVFYRAEPFPRSRYIDPTTQRVSVGDGLFGFPPSELPFVPTGFSAVGRYALPNVAPPIYRWELRPPAGVPMRAGASVPLYGQAGGGVEICLEQDFDNEGPIGNPFILSPL